MNISHNTLARTIKLLKKENIGHRRWQWWQKKMLQLTTTSVMVHTKMTNQFFILEYVNDMALDRDRNV